MLGYWNISLHGREGVNKNATIEYDAYKGFDM
jgi:hypothetical protein